MKLLDAYFKEYIALVNYLLKEKDDEALIEKLKVKDDVIYIRREFLFSLFSKHPYEKNQIKLETWGILNLINREKEALSKKVYMGENKRCRMIVIDRKRFEHIQYLAQKEGVN